MANPDNKQNNPSTPFKKVTNDSVPSTPASGGISNTGTSNTGNSNTGSSNAGASHSGSANTGTSNTGGSNLGTSDKSSTKTGISDSVTSKGNGGTGAATATAKVRSFYDQAKETAGQAYEAVTDKAATKLDEQKSTLSGGLTTVADSVRQVSDNLGASKTDSGLAEAAAKYTNTTAQKIEDVAGYFETHNVREMARDLEGFARRNPAIFLGAAFGLGLVAARFLKSSPQKYNTAGAGRELPNSSDSVRSLGSAPSKSTSSDDPKSTVSDPVLRAGG